MPNGTQPSRANPIGNPGYPGYTSSNGPNWVDFLTVQYNQSFLKTYNLAYGGATVDSSLVGEYLPTVLDFRQQVNEEFIPDYVVRKTTRWTSRNTLFAAFFGINDVGNSYGSSATGVNATLNSEIFAVYSSLVDQIYQAGGRNFLFLNVPPVDRAPLTTAQGSTTEQHERADIAAFNLKIAALATNLSRTYADTTVFMFDANAIFTEILDDVTSYSQTAGIKNTTAYCTAYQGGTASMDTFDTDCGVPVNEYFWLNSLHPLYMVHNATASQIAALLEL